MMDEYHLKDVTEEAKEITNTDGYKRELMVISHLECYLIAYR